jgi:hypothetical protein
MKQINITIHPFSALIGAAIVCLTMLTVGAVTVQGTSSTRDVSAIENVNEPHPRDFVRIDEGVPFTTPAGKLFHLTSLGGTVVSDWFYICTFDGVVVVTARANGKCSAALLPPGFVASAGTVVALPNSQNGAVATGYLVDA